MTQYLLAVHTIDGVDTYAPGEMEQAFAAVDALNTDLQDQGVWVFAGGLTEPDTATVVRQRDGEFITTDGPFSEAKEQIGGFWVIEVANLDAALEWARKAAAACMGPVEVRPFQDEPDA